jgi:hypothetical protein
MPRNATLPSGPTTNQLMAIQALARGQTVTQSATAAGVDRTTVHRWLRDDPEFIAELNLTHLETADGIRGEIRALASDAVKAVRELVTSPLSPPAVRLKAALAILETVNGMAREAIGMTDAEGIREQRAKAQRDWETWGWLTEQACPAELTKPRALESSG